MSFCSMRNYQNKKDLKKIGKQVQALRETTDFTIEDISDMTGFTRKTIVSIENGGNSDLSHIIEIAKAIGVHPKEIFNIPFDIKPRYKLSPQRLNSNLLTKRLNKISTATDFFNTPRLVSEVINYFLEEFNLKVESTKVSVVLKRLTSEGKLTYNKLGRKNVYYKRKK